MSAAQVALFAPYCGGVAQGLRLAAALETLAQAELEGVRRLRPSGERRFRLRWQAGPSPLEPSLCELRFPELPEVEYRFELPTHQLVAWLMQRRDAELPEQFWHWLLLGRGSPTQSA
jgi:hypothetical protein